MKRALFALVCIVPFFFGPVACHPQNPVTPPQASCPPSGSYTQIPGGTNGTAALTFTATGVSSQTCYLAQGSLPASGSVKAQTGNPTNIAGPTTGGATGEVLLSVTPDPTTGQTATGELWTFFSAPAVTALAPANGTMGTPGQAQVVKPALPDTGTSPVEQAVDCKKQNSTSCGVPIAVGQLALTAKLEK